MKHLILITIIFLSVVFAHTAMADLQIGQIPELITLKDKLGGRLDGTPWSSSEFKDKVIILFYVDPDEKDLNNDASEALHTENFPLEKCQSYAIINMAATWIPNFAISASIEEKQKKYTNTIYIRDYKKALVNKWGLSDNNSDVLAFDKSGKMIFRKDGKLKKKDIDALIKVIRRHIDD